VDKPRGFALALGALLIGSSFFSGGVGRTLHVERNFFGVSKVTASPTGDARQFVHGRTIHGRQFLDPKRAGDPWTFYHREGPLGDVFAAFRAVPVNRTVGVIGLGVGSMVAYAQPDESWTFYDIDPSVLRIAQDTNYFTFLERSRAASLTLVEGDARLRLHEAPAAYYNLLAVDAFTSDAIPVHLITREAVELYLDKLAPGGLLVFHISNRYLDLEPVLGNVAQELRLTTLGWDDDGLTAADYAAGRERSYWVVMARESANLARLAQNTRWQRLRTEPSVGVWSDDFSSPLKVFMW
jgi:SAM-dependent methyltransferase